MTSHAVLKQIRTLLLSPPSWERWNDLVFLLDQVSTSAERLRLVSSTLEHLDRSWPARWRVPNQAWSSSSVGWTLVDGLERELKSFPGVYEVWCPPATYEMGASEEDSLAGSAETPQTEVTLTRPFWVLTIPVTQFLWTSLFSSNPSCFQDHPSHPVEEVCWMEAVAFCNALSRAEGLEEAYVLSEERGLPGSERFSAEVHWRGPQNLGYRLPTEAEWEWACRAGDTTARYGRLREIAWFDENAEGSTRPASTRQPNAWGLYDMLGNVWELCFDGWSETLPGGHLSDPLGGAHAEGLCVARGGSWSYPGHCCRASERAAFPQEARDNVLGFRVVRTASPDLD